MNMLSTIWNALIQESEFGVKLTHFPLAIIESTAIMLIFTFLLNISSSKKQKISYVLISSILATLVRLFVPTTYSPLINLLVLLLCIMVIFKLTLLRGIIALIVPFIFSALFEILVARLFELVIGLSSSLILSIPFYRISSALFVYSCMFLIYFLLKKLNISIRILDTLNLKDKIILISTTILGLVAIYIQLYISSYYLNVLPVSVTILSIFILIAYFIVSMHMIIKTNRLEKANQDIENLQLYNKTLSILYDNIRAFKHDFNNIVQGIGGYIATEDLDGLKKYYKDLLEDCQGVNNLTSLNPETINNPSIFGILVSKYHKADAENIKINMEVFLDLNKLNIKTYELTRILGILLDNSIEAAKECKEKIINVTFRLDPRSNRQLIIIENTYMNKDIDTTKIFEKSYTTKKNNTGLGLWEVNKILKKNTNLSLYTTKNSDFFIQQLEIYLIKNTLA